MQCQRLDLVTLCLCAVLGGGCSREEAKPMASAAPAKAAAAAPVANDRASACEMVTQPEMSAILGGAVAAAPGGNERPPVSTECTYSSGAGPGPYAGLQVDWRGGDAQTLGTATGLAGAVAPAGAADPLQGPGERAHQITAGQVFISTQGHLMMIRFLPRSAEVVAKARRIYETAKTRL